MKTSTNPFVRIRSFSEEHHAAVRARGPIPAERRLKPRYPLNLAVHFRSLSEGSLFSGAGRVVNASSSGILVTWQSPVSEREIRVGVKVEVSIEWPSLLDGRTHLQLIAVGRIVRRGASDFAIRFVRHEFRTLRNSTQGKACLRSDPVEWPTKVSLVG
jgi:hypothetical protein